MTEILVVLSCEIGTTGFRKFCKKILKLPVVPSVGWTVKEFGDVIGEVGSVELDAGSETATVCIRVDDLDFWIYQHGFEMGN